MIRAVIFDFAGVLVQPGSFRELEREFAKEVNLPYVTVRAAIKLNWDEWKLGLISKNGFLNSVIEELALESKYKKILWQKMLDHFELNLSVTKYLTKLKKKGMKLYVMSNFTIDLFKPFAKKYGFKAVFDKYFISEKLGVAKPDREIFDNFLEKTGFLPEQCIFIDNEAENKKTARALGFKVVPVKGLGDKLKKLKLV